MEALLIYWNLSWTEGPHFPIYESKGFTKHSCMQFITHLVSELPDREMIGSFNPDSRVCRIVIIIPKEDRLK